MKSLVVIVFSSLFLQCEIKQNPLAPNGPFGLFTFYLNLSKIGAWSYSDPNPVYSKDLPIDTNVPKTSPLAIVKSYSMKTNLPNGLSLNTTNGYITGTPLELGSSEVDIFANNDFYKEQYSTKLKITVAGFSYLPTYSFVFGSQVSITPTFSENLNASDFQFSITPSLPTGVSINPNTGVVSGTCAEKRNGSYTVTATTQSNKKFIASFQLNIVAWENEAYLKAPNAEAGDNFGFSVSIDGDTIVVGSSGEDSLQTTITNGTMVSSDNSALNAGSAYVFRRIGTTWANEAYLKAPNAETNDLFGTVVSISGDTIVVSTISEDSNQTTITNGTTASSDNSADLSGAAYVFRRTGTTWTNDAYLKAPNAELGDNFGGSVSISGDTIVVGGIGEDSNQTTITNGTTNALNSSSGFGAAYVFRRTGSTWANEAYLKAPNAGMDDFFGWSVSVNNDTIVVGARDEDSNQTTITNGSIASANNSSTNSGAVYVFRRTGTIWVNEAYLKAPNAEANDKFGSAVSISGNTTVVAATGEASNQKTITNGITASADNSATSSGAVYVFRRSGTNWTNEAYLKAPNADANDNFGNSISISADTIVVAAKSEASNQNTITNGSTASADNSATFSGAVYVFRRTGTTWANEAYLKAPNPDNGDNFGESVSISGETIVVGASREDSNQTTITNGTTANANNTASDSGAVYVFRRK
ncbi:MAG TPA: FG-GAP repeat protein [Leptospiraceae bacterium]|nr:FG-GAP repeat protein [Leptospiraceae bacterium]HMW05088.1 FG-GAP repeat protein [Leptospiraceae bacterium]HMX31342.1 FG-GAP repeat protein [Leptospiraceae bacterium]HMY31615.1 FG-GAP repeat protein [Leptospiraceae bacterium]HMZ67495.1 FG-GAP repeat protein [Leptospiraceae bacterium]